MMHEIVGFSSEGEKILGVVVEHYVNPLDDFYVIYADYALHKTTNLDEDAQVILENVIIPACDAALADFRVKRQHLRDMAKCRREVETLIEAISSDMDIKSIMEEDKP